MANAVPAGPYGRVLVATDFSDGAALAVRTARALGLFDTAKVFVLHAFDAPAQGMMLRASTTTERLKDYIAEEKERARADMADFLREVELRPGGRILELVESSVAHTIRACARQRRADLVVMGTGGRTGFERLMLGSVAAEVLRDAEEDVLAVPAVKRR